MGCTSGKAIKKKTTSIEDVSEKKDVAHTTGQSGSDKSAEKNGQVNKQKPEVSTAIQIPGTHTSFLAPDGIPYIDEDVDSEWDTRPHKTGQDRNANIIPNNVEPSSRKEQPVSQNQVAAAGQVQVITTTQQKHTEVKTTSDGEKRVIEVTQTSTQHSTSSTRQQQTDEETAAATKIQANVRGYLDRKKTGSIRAEKKPPVRTEDVEMHEKSKQQQQQAQPGPEIITASREALYDKQVSKEEEKAATRIQANYKGYKTRKELKQEK